MRYFSIFSPILQSEDVHGCSSSVEPLKDGNHNISFWMKTRLFLHLKCFACRQYEGATVDGAYTQPVWM